MNSKPELIENTKTKTKEKPKKKKKIGNFFYDFVKVTGAIPTLIWARVKVIGVSGKKPKKIKGGVLISSNHVSFLDPIIVHCAFWYRRIHSLATTDLYNTKLKDFFFTRMHCIPVDKKNFSMRSLHEVCDSLKENKAVLIFPEGQVNRNANEILCFKSGAVLMAHKSQKPVLPILIIKAEKWYNRQVVLVGEPIDVYKECGEHPTMEELNKVSQKIHDEEAKLYEYYQSLKNKKKKKKDK